ncbi:hypothetical protein C8Q80DRAFT_1271149 [Daedaleopsis nitida]|nr:hypothetical protein C8Q80DRAFT_1271149 [Daedaleopsis nitida]
MALEKHPRLYFADGDVVLAAKQPALATEPPRFQLFRVHKPILRHHSTILANMFGDATPGEIFEDVPLVKLAGDDADGVALMLTFLYYPAEVHFDRWNADTPLTISPALRLTNKHQAELCALLNLSHSRFLAIGAWTNHYGPNVPEPASAIRFALEFACPEILPAAFYTLSRINIEHDWDGGGCDRWARPARWSMLQGRDFIVLLRGIRTMKDYCRRVSSPYGSKSLKILSKRCRPPSEVMFYGVDDLERVEEEYPCYAAVRKIFSVAWRSTDYHDPLLSWKLCMDYRSIEGLAEDLPSEGLCFNCADSLRRRVPRERARLWEKIATWFDPEFDPAVVSVDYDDVSDSD